MDKTEPTTTPESAPAENKAQLTGKATLKLARIAFDKLYDLDNMDWVHHREKLFAICKEEEKGHRGWGPDFATHHTSDTASVADAAKMFAVKRVAEYMNGQQFPTGKDFLHIQKSCFYAAGIVDKYRERVAKAWEGLDIKAISDLDYCQIVKVKHSRETPRLPATRR